VKFQPKSEEEIAAANLLVGGDYAFEVTKAEEQTSKAGNDMVKLQLNIPDEEERSHTVFDYLVGTEGAAYKVRHFAEAVGLLDDYERGELKADDMVGRSGIAVVGIQKQSGYPDKNVIRDYKPAHSSAAAAPAATKKGNGPARDMDDSIPFAPEWR
jgi:hypothetical protein